MTVMRFLSVALLACAFATLLHTGALADATSDIATLKTLFGTSKLDENAFAPNFLRLVPLGDVQSFIDAYKARLGAPTVYARDGFQYRLTSPKGSIGVNIAFDQQGKISSLLFHDEMSADDLAALQKVMSASNVDPVWFEDAFKNAVPPAHVDDVIAKLHDRFGAFVRIDARSHGYYVVFAKGEAHAQISVEPDGKINYLAFTEAT